MIDGEAYRKQQRDELIGGLFVAAVILIIVMTLIP